MKTFKITIFFIVAILAFSACQEDQDFTTVDKNGPSIVGFQESSKTISHFEDKGAVVSKIPVAYLGGGDGQFLKKDVDLTIAVIADKSSAKEGTEFSLATKKVTLKAGAEFVELPLTVNTGSLDLSKPSNVVLQISSSDPQTVVAAKNGQVSITFVGCKANVEDFTYDNKMVGAEYDGTPTLRDYPAEPIILHDGTPNLYRTATTFRWGVGSLTPTAKYDGFVFEVICGDVFIKKQSLGAVYSNQVESLDGDESTPAGKVDADGNITIEYRVIVSDGRFRKVKSTYTKN
ncbi:hypothetical protein [Tenacibaculum piscium]|uniref:Probable lipoprotein n=1 Tax=Tenacibaculum piscium TaxID=1458515 RepID=A0A2H1YHN7_9FLAO|nr:hypothetical protein [Tenacibaculum piscium]MBE7629964.1 hypothetical protein [Tenacibaculum piscium]MBE7670376.1 hypothetical protein [Tenacibaculum piscium]MBE7690528.1 hypothetical protein [Tenacibaculum piscium]SOS75026.1 Probable lipoprotein precursor [Tenacibaculum piscium]